MPEKDKIVFEIKRHIGVLNNHDSGWNKELNLISWNGQKPKYDVRDWDQDHARKGRGVTLYPYEMRRLVDSYIADNNKMVVDTAKKKELEKRERLTNNKRPDYVKPEYGHPEPEPMDLTEAALMDTEADANASEEREVMTLETPPFDIDQEKDQVIGDTF